MNKKQEIFNSVASDEPRRMENKKTFIIMGAVALLVGIMVMGIGQVQAIEDLGNGRYILTSAELSELTDQQIADYMINSFTITHIQVHTDKIELAYNLVYVEPNGIGTYKVFNHGYQTFIPFETLNTCLELTTTANCVGILVTGVEAQTFNLPGNETITITPTYAQAYNHGVSKYNDAIALRDSITQITSMESFVAELI